MIFYNIQNPFLSLYFYIFIFLIIYFYILKIYNKCEKIPNDILEVVKTFKINILFFDIFFIFIYFVLNFLIFLFLRLLYINEKKNGIDYIYSILSLSKIFDTIFILFSLIIYYKTLEIIFYPSIIKIHIYLNKYEKYNNFTEFMLAHRSFMSKKFNKVCIFFWKRTIDEDSLKEDVLAKYQIKYMDFSLNFSNIPIEFYYNSLDYKLWKIVNSNKIFYYFCQFFWLIEKFFNTTMNISKLIYYFPGFLCIFFLIYDLYHNEILYLHYSLLFLLITNFIKKFRYFFESKFSFYDKKFSEFLYFKKSMIISEIKVENIEDLHEYLYLESEEIKRYIKNNFTRDIFMELQYDVFISNNRSKRLLLLFLILISSIFFYYIPNYFFIFIP